MGRSAISRGLQYVRLASASNLKAYPRSASYDYGAAISEPRTLTSKYDELKAQGLFLRSSVNFTKTEWVGNNTNGVVNVTNPDVLVVELRNPDSGSGFYIARQLNSSSTDSVKFNMTINTIQGPLDIPQISDGIVLDGREVCQSHHSHECVC